MRPFRPARSGILFALLVLIAPAALSAKPATPPGHTQLLDYQRRLDLNQLDLFITNFGTIGNDVATSASGLYFPRGTFDSPLYTSGLWVGGKVGGQVRVTVAEYSSEWGPGAAPGGVADNWFDPANIVYKMKAYGGDPADVAFQPGIGGGNPQPDAVAHHAWSDYIAGAVPHGAPMRIHRLPDTNTPDPSDSIDVPGPDLPGDLATWCVFNDLDPSRHTNSAGNTAPLGLQVKQTLYGFNLHPQDGGGTVDLAAIVRFEITNTGGNPIDSAYVAYWADPDVGGANDDLVGWDGENGIGYAYNATNNDFVYGTTPPALGIVLLQSPLPATVEQPFGASSFGRYVNGTDPNSAADSYAALRGLDPQGNPWVDPVTHVPTHFPFPGDPVTGTGWLDTNPADRRMLVSVGPVTLGAGQSTTLTFALVVSGGASRLDSIRRLRCATVALRADFSRGFSRPFDPVPAECQATHIPTCPWTTENWAGECPGPLHIANPNLFNAIVQDVADRARSFEPPPATSNREHFCASMLAGASARQRAEREFYALQANASAQDRGVGASNGGLIGLPLSAAFACPSLVATTVAQLLPRCPDDGLTADYHEVDVDQPRDLQPVDFGLSAYGGGIGFGEEFLNSSLHHDAQPDSFHTVEIRFGAGQTQKAYRYLRLVAPDGSAPPQGRGYLYGGYRDVPFRCVDVTSGKTLDVAFVEKTATDFAGTILPPAQQFATFDSTWMPDESADGAREYLFVTSLPAQGGPRAEFEHDGILFSQAEPFPPIQYAITVHLLEAGEVIEDGEFLHITPDLLPSTGVDRALVLLARQPQGDAATIQAYDEIATCLQAVNQGQLSPSECQEYVPALATLVESDATGGTVALAWYVGEPGAGPFDLERRSDDEGWRTLISLSPDGEGYVRYEDRAITPGARLSYRLVDRRAGGDVAQGEVTVLVPDDSAVRALAASIAFAPGHDLALDLALPRAGEVTWDIVTLAGRRIAGGSFGTLPAGRLTRRVAPGTTLASGVYFVRVRQGGAGAVAKAVFVH